MATQNPIEQEGTYPLPEAQLDRFLMHVAGRLSRREVGSRDHAAGARRGEQQRQNGRRASTESSTRNRCSTRASEIGAITVSEPVENYIVALVFATREPAKLDKDLASWIQVGVSPRGSIGLDKVSRSYAWLKGRDYVTPGRRQGDRA